MFVLGNPKIPCSGLFMGIPVYGSFTVLIFIFKKDTHKSVERRTYQKTVT